mgnify:CR=1 FL=1
MRMLSWGARPLREPAAVRRPARVRKHARRRRPMQRLARVQARAPAPARACACPPRDPPPRVPRAAPSPPHARSRDGAEAPARRRMRRVSARGRRSQPSACQSGAHARHQHSASALRQARRAEAVPMHEKNASHIVRAFCVYVLMASARLYQINLTCVRSAPPSAEVSLSGSLMMPAAQSRSAAYLLANL